MRRRARKRRKPTRAPKKGSYFTLLRKSRLGTYLFVGILMIGIATVSGVLLSQQLRGIGPVGSAHIHQKIAVYIDGKRMDLAPTTGILGDEYSHFHAGDGLTLHIHATGVTIGHVLQALGLSDKGSFVVFVNGARVDGGVNHQPKDLDEIMITNTPELADIQWAEFAEEL